MEKIISIPNRNSSENLLKWAEKMNPGDWSNHSRVVARIAETIAKKIGLDPLRAYTSGLLHDIGRYEGKSGFHHIVER